MSYSEAYHIFGEFDKDHKERGVCLANIGSIMYQMEDYQKAQDYYKMSQANMNLFIMKDMEEGGSKT